MRDTRDRPYDDEVKLFFVTEMCEHLSDVEHAHLVAAMQENVDREPDEVRPTSAPIPERERSAAIFWTFMTELAIALRFRDVEEKHPGPDVQGEPFWMAMARTLARTAAADVQGIIEGGTMPTRQHLPPTMA